MAHGGHHSVKMVTAAWRQKAKKSENEGLQMIRQLNWPMYSKVNWQSKRVYEELTRTAFEKWVAWARLCVPM